MALRSSAPAAVGAVCAAMLADSLLYSVIVPVLPGYAERLGASPFAIGLLFASYAVALLLVTPLVGALSDRTGRRVPLILGMAGVAAATVVFAYATTYEQLLVARSLQGAAGAAVWTSGVALVADRVRADRLGVSMGVVMASMSAGLIMGPPVGGVLAEAFGYRAPFLVAAAVAAGCAVVMVVFAHDAADRAVRPSRMRALLADRDLRRSLVVVMTGAAALSMLEPLLPLDLSHRLGAGTAAVGLVFGAATLAHLIASPPIGAMADRYPPRHLMPIGLLGMGAVMPFLATPDQLVGVAGLLVLFAVAYSLVLVPALPAIAAVVRNRHDVGYAAAYGAFNISYAVGMVTGPVAGSAAASQWSIQPVLVGSALVLLAGGLLLLRRLPAAALPRLSPLALTRRGKTLSISSTPQCLGHDIERRNP